MKKKVLLDGDELGLISVLKDAFEKEGYNVFCEHESDEVINKINEIKPDLTVLVFDTRVNLDICRSIKHGKEIHETVLIIIGNRNIDQDKHDVIEGLSLGAEDFVSKPIDADIFIAKVRAIMNRLSFRREPDDVLITRNLKINLTSHAVFIDKKKVELTPKELALLYYLVSNRGKVLKREFLMEHVWEQEYLGDPRTINKHIETLRRKTREFAKNIETVQGVGYKFNG